MLGGAQADHDQHHLGSFEEHTFEGHGKTDTVVTPTWAIPAVLVELGHRLGVDLVLVVLRLVPARSEDGLAQPAQPEHEQESADDHPERVDRDVAQERDAHSAHEHSEDHRGGAGPENAERQPRLTPAATTMVSASTISTRLAPKTAMTSTRVEEVCMVRSSPKLPGIPGGVRRVGQG